MRIKKRHRRVSNFVRPFFKVFFRMKYNLKVKTTSLPEEGSLILSNHLTSMDQFIVGVAFKEPIYYMASIDIFEHKFIGKLIDYLVAPIHKEKSKKSDLKCIKECISLGKENGHICIFPEGNRSYSGNLCYINESIVKLAKVLKKPIVLFNIIGGYGTSPRWADNIRKGKMDAFVKKVISYEEYKDIDNDELMKIILKELDVNNFNDEIRFKSKRKAEYLERVFFVCPRCEKMSTLVSSYDEITCTNCKMSFKYNENLTLSSNDKKIKFNHVNEWYDYQKDWISKYDFTLSEEIFTDDKVSLKIPRLYDSRLFINEGRLVLKQDEILIQGKKEVSSFKLDDIDEMTILGKNKLNFYVGQETYQIKGTKRLNVLKYMYYYYLRRNKKEGRNNEFLGL